MCIILATVWYVRSMETKWTCNHNNNNNARIAKVLDRCSID